MDEQRPENETTIKTISSVYYAKLVFSTLIGLKINSDPLT